MFVVMENSSHHRNSFDYEAGFLNEIEQAYKEDLSLYESSAYYIATYNKTIIGSVKITLWDEQTLLPIEKLFGIRCKELSIFDDVLIWHVGRLAISKNNNPYGMKLLMKLLTLAIYSICQHTNSIMIAECDKKLLRGLNMMGIKTEILAPGIEYLGSETIPVYATDEWLKVFLENNCYVDEVSKIAGYLSFSEGFRLTKHEL
ncbi:MAG: hypothetical protein B6D37_09255 [Sphingobacteriales bacterium UTBCD1]|nr:MAG: hypothetical protein B6D37_09255 [Sphingobacteriales bacterium UTBCD1]